MCGIAGIVNIHGNNVDAVVLSRMASTLRHRGPDDEGFYYSDTGGSQFRVALAHRRLSIIDLSHNASQPMANEKGDIWLVYNGEIYNFKDLRDTLIAKGHVFKSNTDSEVIIHLYEEYGQSCLDYLRGMFSFCIWDQKKNALFLARDRVGKKPLVYFHNKDFFVFASELKALLEDKRIPRELDLTSVADFFTYGYVPSPKTIFKNIFKLPPGHKLWLDKSGISLKRYWTPDYSDKIFYKNDLQYEEKIDELFSEAVRLRLISDVPLGVFLSGGIDSSAVLSHMSRNSKGPVKTFSIGFKEEAYNELGFASIAAKQHGAEHKEFIVTIEAKRILPKLIWFYNEPFGDSSCIPTYYVSQMTRRFVKVALSGDGGDEAFGGYNRYRVSDYLTRNGYAGKMFAHSLSCLTKGAGRVFQTRKRNHYVRRLSEAFLFSNQDYERYAYLMAMFPTLGIFTETFLENIKGYNALNYFRDVYSTLSTKDSREFSMNLDFFTYLPEDLMVKTDIASMANSLEVRSPLLDHKLLEFAFRIPFEKKVRFFDTKIIFKNYLKRRGMLSDKLLRRKKQGFAVPIGEWFKGELKDYLYDMLSDSVFIKNGFFNRDAIESMIKEHCRNEQDHTHRLWSLLNFEIWHKIFVEGQSPESLVG